MNILYVAAECAPFIKTGGLADVAGSLPKALNDLGQDCRVVMPLHSQIPEKFLSCMEKISEFYVDLGWKHEYCGVLELDWEGVKYYFLDNKYYFNRPSIYGQFDDAERYIFFSKAAVRLPRILDWKVDIINANDWHSGLVPVFLNDYRTGDDFYKKTRSVYTIHNLKYQGQFSQDVFYWTNLNGFYMSDYDLKYYDSINFMKGGIVHATRVNTVSPNYAEEIRYPFFAEGLDNVISANSGKISGILNGIDTEVWNSEKDPFIAKNYTIKTLEDKKVNKAELQEMYGLPVKENIPVVSMVSRLTSMKGLELVRYIMDELMQEDVQLVVLGTGDYEYEEMFKHYGRKYPKKCAARIYYSNEESHKIYAGSDIFLMPSLSEPCGLSQMISMRYGTVPLVREAGGLMDSVEAYNKYEKTGEGFRFAHINAHELLFTIKDAINLYRTNKKDFTMLQENGMKKDLSWKNSSKQYLKLYEEALEN